ncbi:MAG: 30S ribosomal protein S19e [Candidatus Aenigmarchaeota archaeon]|nr:30S ribosomal protein S19e [Candidatus Aenigmarchaeota archaeon]
MVSIREADTQKLIIKAAEALKGMEGMKMPDWARFVKTGPSRERPPEQDDWWWIRGASVLRKIYLEGRGISKLRKVYSGRKNRGHQPEKMVRGSGKIIRTLLKQLEGAGMVKIEKGKGRVITPLGQKFMDKVAKEVK